MCVSFLGDCETTAVGAGRLTSVRGEGLSLVAPCHMTRRVPVAWSSAQTGWQAAQRRCTGLKAAITEAIDTVRRCRARATTTLGEVDVTEDAVRGAREPAEATTVTVWLRTTAPTPTPRRRTARRSRGCAHSTASAAAPSVASSG